MKKLNLLSKAEMKKVLGGKQYSGGIELCDSSNGSLWHSECIVGGYALNANNQYEWVSHHAPDLTTWDAGAPCGGQCSGVSGVCMQYYACNDQTAV